MKRAPTPAFARMLCVTGLCLLLLAWVVSAAESSTNKIGPSLFEADPYMIDLSASDAMAALHPESQRCPWLLIYYDSSCGHCRTMAPHLARFSVIAATNKTRQLQSLLIGSVNCAVYDQECRQHNITDVPTLFFVAPGSAHWQLLSGTEDTEAAVRKAAAPSLSSLQVQRAEACHSLLEFLAKDKRRAIAERQSSTTATTSFTEERAFRQEDVAGAFYYTMRHEVPMVPLRGENLRGLISFLEFVAYTLPGLQADLLLSALRTQPAGTSFMASQWQALVERTPIPFVRGSDAREEIRWTTCKGSSWQYRGFTCGMWLLYHSLTVNVVDERSAKEVLQHIRWYVTHYFSCGDCRAHFSQFEFSTKPHPALQLWRAHNNVNERLSHTVDGMDPLVPKRQFPDRSHCPSCFTSDGQPIEDNVLVFLKRWYAWNASAFLQSSSQGGAGDPEETCGIDTCQLRPAATTTALITVPQHQAMDRRKSRSPMFIVRHDPFVLNFTLTLFVVLLCVYAGMRFAFREMSPIGFHKHQQRRRVNL